MTANALPDLPARFLPPPGWRFDSFVNADGKTAALRACIAPAAPNGHVVALEGLSEFAEKYFEFAQDCLDRGLGFWVLDWRGQGGSDRFYRRIRQQAPCRAVRRRPARPA